MTRSPLPRRRAAAAVLATREGRVDAALVFRALREVTISGDAAQGVLSR